MMARLGPGLRLRSAWRSHRSAPTSAADAARSSRRWATWGGLTGLLAGLVVFAPANWLASWVQTGTQGRVQLARAEGTVWSGSAQLVLTGGPGSRDARLLPGRMSWTLRPGLTQWALQLQHAPYLNGPVELRFGPGLGRLHAEVRHTGNWIGQFPTAWLAGLGTPWNTVQPGGALRIDSRDLALEWAKGRLMLRGELSVELRDLSSRLVTLPRLGSYRISLRGDPDGSGTALVTLTTQDGSPLRLSANGSWSASGLRLRGEAAAASDNDMPALANLLNIIGRREGTRTLLTIG
jgi:general secretion pathway protein N